jgi:excisionase family DNA binding protein
MAKARLSARDQGLGNPFLVPSGEEQERFAGLARSIDLATRITVALDDEDAVELTPVLREGLARLVAYFSQGSAVAISPVDQYLSTQEAADLLGVSRPHAIKLLEGAGYTFRRLGEAGAHRRIALTDVMAYMGQTVDDSIIAMLDRHKELAKKYLGTTAQPEAVGVEL